MLLIVQVGLDAVESPDGVLVQMSEIIINLPDIGINLVDLLLVLLNIEQRDPADWNLQEVVNIIIRDLTHKLVKIRLKTCPDCLDHSFLCPLLLNPLVDALLNENALKGSCVQLVKEMSPLDLELLLGDLDNVVRVVADDIAHGADMRKLVADDQTVDRNLLLAECVGVKGVNDILGVCALGKRDLDVHLVSGEVTDTLDLESALLDGLLNGLDHLLAVDTERKLLYDDLLCVGSVQLCPDCNRAKTVLVVRDIHDSAAREIGEQLELITADGGYLSVYDL